MDSIQSPDAQSLAYLTADLPGVGGVIKRFDEDFVVDELPLYPASGEGTHIYFTIEKRGLTTLAAVRIIARSLGRQPRDIGYAGLKDAHGITRQTLSIEHIDPGRIESLELARIKIVSITRHKNKIKLGHLAGNRFIVKIRDTVSLAPRAAGFGSRESTHSDRVTDVSPGDDLKSAQSILDVLVARGLANYFGPQRFGVRGDNARVGLAVLRDDYDEAIALILGRPGESDHGDIRRARELFDAGDLQGALTAWARPFAQQQRVCRAYIRSGGNAHKAWRAVDHTLRKLYVSAFQSELFNQVVTRRIDSLDRLLTGDIAYKHRNRACFAVQDAAVEQPRCDAFEISPTGPLFGRRMSAPTGPMGELEDRVLAESGLSRGQMRVKDGTKLDGARRPLRVPLTEATIDAAEDDRGPYLRVTFALPPGSYATCVTREICKVT